MRNQQSGFTLVEIAIVLVIIGLLLGGVLKGQELINSAKVKNFANEFRNIATFVYAYQDRFKRLPGDDPAANTNVAAPAGTVGNGNARINGAWNAAPPVGGACGAIESCNFWTHVRLAGLATGTDNQADANYIPRNADGGPIGITGDAVSTVVPNPWPANFYVCTAGIQGRFARQLDMTIDDGNTATGTVRVLGTNAGGTLATHAAFYTVLAADDATLFTVCSAN